MVKKNVGHADRGVSSFAVMEVVDRRRRLYPIEAVLFSPFRSSIFRRP